MFPFWKINCIFKFKYSSSFKKIATLVFVLQNVYYMYLLYTVQYCRLCCGKKLHLRCSTQYYPLSTVCSIQYLHIQYYTTKGDYQERTFGAINHGFFITCNIIIILKKNSHGQHSFISMNVLKNSSAFYR